MNIENVVLFLLEFITYGSFIIAGVVYFKTPQNSISISLVKYLGLIFIFCEWYWSYANIVFFNIFYLTGLTLIICGMLLFFYSLYTVGKKRLDFAFTPSAPNFFVHMGPYRFVRHPIYTSYILTWLGSAVSKQEAILIIPLAVMTWIYYTATVQEESSFLESNFVNEYTQYKNQAGRFFPKLF